jgi:hypothetical protein
LPLCALWRGRHPDVDPKVHTHTEQHRKCDVRGTAMKLRSGTTLSSGNVMLTRADGM